MKKIGIIIGSTRPGRRSSLIAEWFAKNLPQAELTYDIIDLADFALVCTWYRYIALTFIFVSIKSFVLFLP